MTAIVDQVNIPELIEQLDRDGKIAGKTFIDLLVSLPLGKNQSNYSMQGQVRRELRRRGYTITGGKIVPTDGSYQNDGDGRPPHKLSDSALSLSLSASHDYSTGWSPQQKLNYDLARQKIAMTESRSSEIVDGMFRTNSSSLDARHTELAAMLENPRRTVHRPAAAFSVATARDRTDELADLLMHPHDQQRRHAGSFSLDDAGAARPDRLAHLRENLSPEELKELEELLERWEAWHKKHDHDTAAAFLEMLRNNVESKGV